MPHRHTEPLLAARADRGRKQFAERCFEQPFTDHTAHSKPLRQSRRFTDPMVDCRACKRRFRSDKLEDDVWVHFCEATKGNKFNIPGGEACKHCDPKAHSLSGMRQGLLDDRGAHGGTKHKAGADIFHRFRRTAILGDSFRATDCGQV
jgi:hypothetical protein